MSGAALISGGNQGRSDWPNRMSQLDAENSAYLKKSYSPGWVFARILGSLILLGGGAVGAYFGFKAYAGVGSVTGVFAQIGSGFLAVDVIAFTVMMWKPHGWKTKLTKEKAREVGQKLRGAKSYGELRELCFQRIPFGYTPKMELQTWVNNGIITENLKKKLEENVVLGAERGEKEKRFHALQSAYPDRDFSTLRKEIRAIDDKIMSFDSLMTLISNEASRDAYFMD